LTKACQHTSQMGTGFPKFWGRTLKFGLTFSVCVPKTLRLAGVTPQNFHVTFLDADVIIWVQLLAAPPPKILEGKTSKIPRDAWRILTLMLNISRADRHDKRRKSKWSTTTPPMLGEKVAELWSTVVHVLMHWIPTVLAISDNFRLCWRMSPAGIQVSKSLPRWSKKSANFGSLTRKL